MKKIFLLFFILGSLTLAACSSGSNEDCVTVTINGETTTICGDLDELDEISGSGSGSDPDSNPVNVEGEDSASDPATDSANDTANVSVNSFSGTWCFESGIPYYLAIVINEDESSAEVAYHLDNSNFLNDLSDDLVFSSRSFSVSEGLGQLQTFGTSSVSGPETDIQSNADVEFANQEQITVDFGSFTAGYDRLGTDGSCSDLTISQDDKDILENL